MAWLRLHNQKCLLGRGPYNMTKILVVNHFEAMHTVDIWRLVVPIRQQWLSTTLECREHIKCWDLTNETFT